MSRGRDRLPAESLSPLAASVDEVLASYRYEMGPAIEAIDGAVPGYGGLFDPRTTDDERRAAIEEVLAAGPPSPPSGPDSAAPGVVCYVDGSSRGNPGPAGAGAVLQADGTPVARLGRPVGSHADNNTAEYAALLLGLDAVVTRFDRVPAAVEVRIDSMTVVEDIWGGGGTHGGTERYRDPIEGHLSALEHHEWTHLADDDPNPADARATVGADIAALGP